MEGTWSMEGQEGHGGAWRSMEGHWGWVSIERADLVIARCRLTIAIAIAVIVIAAVPALA
jgi:hypothetical protein